MPIIKAVSVSLTIVVSTIALAGCSSSSSTVTGSDEAYVPATTYSSIDETTPEAQAFIANYRSSFPELSGGADRPDRYILKNGIKLCGEIEFQEITHEYLMTFDEMKAYVTPRVTGGNVTRPATNEEADGIVRSAVNSLCPVYATQLPQEAIVWN